MIASLKRYGPFALAALALLALLDPALAQEATTEAMEVVVAAEAAPTIDTGDTAWMLTSTALVLLMTIPGVALFYGGMVRKKNVLDVSDAELRHLLHRDADLVRRRVLAGLHAERR